MYFASMYSLCVVVLLLLLLASIVDSKDTQNITIDVDSDGPKGLDEWKIRLGQSTWFYYHSIAAQYPENPSIEQQEAILQLMQITKVLYPCEICRWNLQEHVEKMPSLAMFTGLFVVYL